MAVTRQDPTDTAAQTTEWVVTADGEPDQTGGVVYAIAAVPDRTLYAAEGHDFAAEQTGAFIPLGLGVFDDAETAAGAVEWHLRGR